ncbi:hypothetical protein B296_00048527 [Ensete ventricosum]|uniref:Uncharacterized protein n=1 Tax=Ensete ventricosum TaxID=4639 RepID=A0A426YIK0_ENSVE|nr:hypothetical protein B296_00048527 [Ensete ventricosum]
MKRLLQGRGSREIGAGGRDLDREQNFRESRAEVEFRSIFHAPSRKLKIMAISDVLAHGKSYEHGFGKKCDGHKLCDKSHAESSFDRFFVHRLGN